MNVRQAQLLNTIINEYINSAEPVGSAFIVSKYNFDVSPATIRNEMAILEKDGYITQPHTSAGRIPTEKGYKYFVEKIFINTNKLELDERLESRLNLIITESDDFDKSLKSIARAVAEITGETILVGFNKNNLYYTGISNLFKKPEFADQEVLINFTSAMDAFEEMMDEFFCLAEESPKVLIGKENPLSEECSSIVTRFKVGNVDAIFSVLGLMRMNYATNIAVSHYVKQLWN